MPDSGGVGGEVLCRGVKPCHLAVRATGLEPQTRRRHNTMPSNESRHCEHYLQSFNGLLSTDMMNASKIFVFEIKIQKNAISLIKVRRREQGTDAMHRSPTQPV